METALITGRDIVITGQQPWDTEIGSNCKNIAAEMARHNRVLYVNSPLDSKSILLGRRDPKITKRLEVVQGKTIGLEQITGNLWSFYPEITVHSVNWLRYAPLFDYLNKINNRNFSQSIKRTIKELGFKDIILFNDGDIFKSFYLKEFLQPEVSIYYSRDYFIASDYWKKHGVRLEPQLIAKSDVCTANSVFLADYCKKYNPNSFYVGQGCELELFTRSRKDLQPRAEMQHLPRPVIGYAGALESSRLDLEIIETIAVNRPEWSIVLAGPEDDIFKTSRLHSISNIHFLGRKKPQELPAYIEAFDVCLNPQLINELTVGNYPRKIDEYLAMGKPVIASRTPAMEIFNGIVYLSDSKENYVGLIEQALKENTEEAAEERENFARSHTWENSVNEIYKALYIFKNQTKA